MKNIIFHVLISLYISNINAQITITNATFPKVGDTLKTAVVFDFAGNLTMGSTGGPKTWDFNILNVDEGIKQQEIYLNPAVGKDASSFPEATMMLLSDGQEIYLKSSATKLEGLGFGGANQFFDAPLVIKYSKRPVLRTAPLEFINTTATTGEFRIDISSNIIPDSLLAGLPFKPDSIRIQFSNSIKGLTDAYGSLKLQGNSFDVLRETGGILPIASVDSRVMIIMDLKCPSSGMLKKNLYPNIRFLKKNDEVKFVIGSREDYEWSKEIISKYELKRKCGILFSVVFSTLEPVTLVNWILEDKLDVRFQLQMHKFIWHPETKGV